MAEDYQICGGVRSAQTMIGVAARYTNIELTLRR